MTLTCMVRLLRKSWLENDALLCPMPVQGSGLGCNIRRNKRSNCAEYTQEATLHVTDYHTKNIPSSINAITVHNVADCTQSKLDV